MKTIRTVTVALAAIGASMLTCPVLGTSPRHHPVTQHPQQAAALITALNQAIAKRHDKFMDTNLIDELNGKPFHFVFSWSSHGTMTDWDYNDGVLILRLMNHTAVLGGSPEAMGSRPEYSVLFVAGTSHDGGNYIGQNTYGARTVVRTAYGREYGIAVPQMVGKDVAGNTVTYPDQGWSTRVRFSSGAAAKAALLDSEAVVDGTYQRGYDCNYVGSVPTIDAPIAGQYDSCWINAKITHVVFRRKSTGEVLDEWHQ